MLFRIRLHYVAARAGLQDRSNHVVAAVHRVNQHFEARQFALESEREVQAIQLGQRIIDDCDVRRGSFGLRQRGASRRGLADDNKTWMRLDQRPDATAQCIVVVNNHDAFGWPRHESRWLLMQHSARKLRSSWTIYRPPYPC